jgi:hypothetical protein
VIEIPATAFMRIDAPKMPYKGSWQPREIDTEGKDHPGAGSRANQ